MRVEASRAGLTRRSRFGCGVAVFTAAVVAGVGCLLAALFFVVSGGGSQVAASFIRAQPGAVHWDSHTRLTALLIGRASDDPGSVADSLTVATFDPAAQSVRLLSIPTNLWVNIPGYGPGRLGDALADGGTREQVLTVESALRVPLPYYAVAGPKVMAEVTDALGGVTVGLSAPLSLGGIRLGAGRRHLDGRAAVAYAHPGAADPQSVYAGLLRQQSVLFALKKQTFTTQNFFRIPGLLSSLGGSVHTNFPYDQVLDLTHQLSAVPSVNMTGETLSYLNGTVAGYDAQNGEVSLPNWQAIRTLARAVVPPDRSVAGAALTVVNGTGVTGQAVTLTAWLRGDAVHVSGYRGGPPQGYATTHVQISPAAGAPARALARTVALLLQVPVVTGPVPAGSPQVLLLMGRDYQDPTQQ